MIIELHVLDSGSPVAINLDNVTHLGVWMEAHALSKYVPHADADAHSYVRFNDGLTIYLVENYDSVRSLLKPCTIPTK
jgi:hypothetical protein